MSELAQVIPIRSTRIHRAWWVASVTGLVIVAAGWSTGVPGLLTDPLHAQFGWSRGTIGFAFAVNVACYGVTAPFSAALMDRFGIRRVLAIALSLTAIGAAVTAGAGQPWQLILGWGVLVGSGTGAMALTLAATVTGRWFGARRGLVSGLLSAGNMVGGMALMPLLAWLVGQHGWRIAITALAVVVLILVPLVWLVVRGHPGELGLSPYGTREFVPPPPPITGAARRAVGVLVHSARTRPFWLLVGTYAVCGASTNGIMMTHFVPAAADHGMSTTTASALLAIMGVYNIAGAAGSGWLTDRIAESRLLASYYGFRALSLMLLPLCMAATMQPPIVLFAVCYGLLDLATVPPTMALSRKYFGADGPIVFGWLSAAHQLGAAATTFLGGLTRALAGSYTPVWLGSGVLCLCAALLSFGLREIHQADQTKVRPAPRAARFRMRAPQPESAVRSRRCAR